MSSRFLRGELATSPVTDRVEPDRTAIPLGINSGPPKRHPSNSDGRLASLGSSLTPEDRAMLVRNVAEVAAAAATLAIHNSQSPSTTPQATPQVPPVSVAGPSPKYTVPRTPDARHHGPPDWEQGNADLADAGMGGGHDAPNWSRTKSSMILLGATILYAIIAGMAFTYNADEQKFWWIQLMSSLDLFRLMRSSSDLHYSPSCPIRPNSSTPSHSR